MVNPIVVGGAAAVAVVKLGYYGNWGGLYWSGGEVIPPGSDKQVNQAVDGVDALDRAFKQHDISYENAQNAEKLGTIDHAEYLRRINEADQKLLDDMKGIDPSTLEPGGPEMLKRATWYFEHPFTDAGRTDLSWNGIQKVNPFSNDHYLGARGWIRRDPLAIDLDGDGIETVGIAGGVLFDHDGDGIKTGTGWVKSDDALVVLDRNGNGLIDTGNELFGVDYVKSNGQKALNGFDALADLDGNGDHLFNASDAQYANVKIWRDMNQDGISQTNELQSLSAAGITAINLVAHSATKNLGNGNTQTLTADVAGNVGDIVALNLADNPFYRQFPDHLDTTAVASLPDMQGSGRLRDLKEAATLSTTLASQLADLQTNYRSHEQFDAALDSLIQNWANTSDWSTTPVGYQVPTLFSGSGYSGLPIAKTSPGLHLMQAPSVLGGGMVPYAIIYQPQGITKEQLWGAYRVPLSGTAPLLPEKYLRAVYLIETLERYNGLPFINFNIETGAVTTATGRAIPPEQAGGGSVQTYPIPVYVPINDAQLTLLEQSYAELRQSVSDGLILQTRLKGYMDAIALQIDANGIRLDFGGVEMMLAGRKATDAKAASRESRRWWDGGWARQDVANDVRWRRVA